MIFVLLILILLIVLDWFFFLVNMWVRVLVVLLCDKVKIDVFFVLWLLKVFVCIDINRFELYFLCVELCRVVSGKK